MMPWLLAPALAAGAWYLTRGHRARSRALVLTGAWLDARDANPAVMAGRPEARFPRRYRWAPWAMAAAVMAALIAIGLPMPLPAAFAALAGAGAWMLETHLAERQMERMEAQLADAIDLMVGSLRAGASLMASLDAALREARQPFAAELGEATGRMRLGDHPAEAVSAMARRVPLETFRFFAVSVAVHWETGGSLSSTLGSVARTIRERVEMSRRKRAQAVEANFSVVAVLLITHGVAVMMWRSNPASMEGFLASKAGSWIAAACVFLQAIGAVWIAGMSRADQ